MFTEITPAEYLKLDLPLAHCYNLLEFNELNSGKVDGLRCLVWYGEGKARASMILGEDGVSFRSPFSAPFGGLNFRGIPSDALLETVLSDLRSMAREERKPVVVTPPPHVYGTDTVKFCLKAMNSSGVCVTSDYNYHFDTQNVPRYESLLPKTVRYNLHAAQRCGFRFMQAHDYAGKEEAFDVIRRNRESLSYALRMTFAQVMETSEIITADFFLMRNDNDTAVAAALCYHVRPGVVQVIYWGDIPEYRQKHTMNYFVMCLFAHYHDAGVRILDIGPASTDGVPNVGLCSFKESVGCGLTVKQTFEIDGL